ncbi:MAG: hypothetical protein QG636_357 [Patescibacteria group bacterium]|jgi:glycosyltransferase involved in cell wall biosynthesis|nr:hypothetical protein [Patescibacteria group bacterium]
MISVLVVAHNEEAHIAACLDSLMRQTLRPEEILVIVHNSTDATADIASKYLVRVIEYTGPAGSIYARMKGFESVAGDIVACIDGDAEASPGWLHNIVLPLNRPTVSLVGGPIFWKNTPFMQILSLWIFFGYYPLTRLLKPEAFVDVWGANFALRIRDYRAVGGLSGLESVRDALGFEETYWPDDLYLTLRLRTQGSVAIAHRATVSVTGKERGNAHAFMLSARNRKRAQMIIRYMRKGSL